MAVVGAHSTLSLQALYSFCACTSGWSRCSEESNTLGAVARNSRNGNDSLQQIVIISGESRILSAPARGANCTFLIKQLPPPINRSRTIHNGRLPLNDTSPQLFKGSHSIRSKLSNSEAHTGLFDLILLFTTQTKKEFTKMTNQVNPVTSRLCLQMCVFQLQSRLSFVHPTDMSKIFQKQLARDPMPFGLYEQLYTGTDNTRAWTSPLQILCGTQSEYSPTLCNQFSKKKNHKFHDIILFLWTCAQPYVAMVFVLVQTVWYAYEQDGYMTHARTAQPYILYQMLQPWNKSLGQCVPR